MKNLFAAASYTFNNFYNNLNTQGQMIFSTIMFLIVLLCILLFITYVIQGIQAKRKLKKLKNNEGLISKSDVSEVVKSDNIKKVEEVETLSLRDDEVVKKPENQNEISDIAKRVEDAMKEETPITLTNFEEDQERTAIISIDELMAKAKELELIDDEENTGINYLEKYNLEPSEVNEVVTKAMGGKESAPEVKAFKVSQVISPVYGIKKEAINSNNH